MIIHSILSEVEVKNVCTVREQTYFYIFLHLLIPIISYKLYRL